VRACAQAAWIGGCGRFEPRLAQGRCYGKVESNPLAEEYTVPHLRDNEDVALAITRDPETMHGIAVFRGTRVAVETLFEYLEGGDTLEDFLEGFPTVPRTLALQALEEAKELLLASG